MPANNLLQIIFCYNAYIIGCTEENMIRMTTEQKIKEALNRNTGNLKKRLVLNKPFFKAMVTDIYLASIITIPDKESR